MGAVAPTWCHPEGLSPPILVPQAQTHGKSAASLLVRLDQCLSKLTCSFNNYCADDYLSPRWQNQQLSYLLQ